MGADISRQVGVILNSWCFEPVVAGLPGLKVIK